MTEQEKQILLIDLCARLPYGVKAYYKFNDGTEPEDNEQEVTFGLLISYNIYHFTLKTYLRPMSSMTEEEKIELCTICYLPDEAKTIDEKMYILKINMDGYDWLNAHHFDYRGLIEKGLALESPKDMYKILNYENRR